MKSTKAKKPQGADKWAFTPQDNGVLKAKAPSMKSTEVDKRWDKRFETFTPFARLPVEVGFTSAYGSANSATDNADLVSKDEKALLNMNRAFDGGGVTNEAEVKAGSGPANEGENPAITAPTVNPMTDNAKRISGRGDRPHKRIIVTLPNGEELEVTTDANGNWPVDLSKSVEPAGRQNQHEGRPWQEG